MKQAIIFDLEGTLVTLDRQYHITDLALKESKVYLNVPTIYKIRGFDKYNRSEEFFKALIAINKFGLAPEILINKKIQESIDKHIQKLDQKDLVLAEKIRERYKNLRYGGVDIKDELYPGTMKALKSLSKNYLLGIYTARKQKSAANVLIDLKIDKFFSFVLGEETKRAKMPHLKIQKELSSLGVVIKKSYLVGDSETDISQGKQIGLKTILVLTGNASIALQKQTKPDYAIETIEELPKILTI
jgi:HAD superfamily hydrolase (TIGR01549 family)